MTIKTKQISTKGEWKKIADVFGITFTDDNWYTIQIVGVAKVSYGATIPTTDCFTVDFPQPFSYKKESGEDPYIFTDVNVGAVVTIAG